MLKANQKECYFGSLEILYILCERTFNCSKKLIVKKPYWSPKLLTETR